MTTHKPSSPHTIASPKSEQSKTPNALCALARLLARHAVGEANGVGTEQLARAKKPPIGTGALNDV